MIAQKSFVAMPDGSYGFVGNSYANEQHYVFGRYTSGTVVKYWSSAQLREIELTREVLKFALPEALTWHESLSGSHSGTDPEIFAELNGMPVPAWKWLGPETEALAIPRGDDVYGCNPTAKAYWDGAQAELSTSGKQRCHVLAIEEVQWGLKQIYNALQRKFPAAQLVCRDVVRLTDEDLATGPEEALAFGCMPSFNAYGIPRVEIGDSRAEPLRFSGCHIHESIPLASIGSAPAWFPDGVAVMMDKTLGILLTALGRDLEDPIRRRYYGRPGEYRLPQRADLLSLEYRTPGSFLLSHPALMNFAFDAARRAFKLGMFLDGRLLDIPDVKDIILACDADAALKVISEHKQIFEKFLPYLSALKAVTLGAKKFLSQNVAESWGLDGTWRPYNNAGYASWSQVTSNL